MGINVKKVLIIATEDTHIQHFHLPFIKLFKQHDFQVDIATSGDYINEDITNHHHITFSKNPFSFKNIQAIGQIKRLLKKNNYDLLQLNTPIAAFITRLAAKKFRKNGLKIYYIAHGFHFYKDAPIINRFVYYPLEKLMAKQTDLLVTINDEDYENARKICPNRVAKINGVGVKLDKFIGTLKSQFGEPIKLLSVGELRNHKNQVLAIKAVFDLANQGFNLQYDIVGAGQNFQSYQQLIKKLKLEQHVNLLGYRTDIPELLDRCDIFISTSIREGLGLNVIEAMAMKRPVVATRSRGSVALIKDYENGLLTGFTVSDFSMKIKELIENPQFGEKFAKYNEDYLPRFGLDTILKEITTLYFPLR